MNKNIRKSFYVSMVAAALHVGQAFALPPATTPDIELFLAGATAEKNIIPNLLGGFGPFTRYGFSYPAGAAICQPGTLDFFYDAKSGSRAGFDYRAYSCRLTTNAALLAGYTDLAGKAILIHYRQKNGSWYGTGPLVRQQPVVRMRIDGNCITSRPPNTGATPVPVASPASFPITTTAANPAPWNTPTYICPTESIVGGVTTINNAQLVTTEVPDLGIADNEPAIFIGKNAPNDGNPNANGQPAYDAAIRASELDNVITTPVFAFPITIAATKKLINAMQTAQGRAVTAAGVAVTDADRPSINFPQISSLFSANGGPYNTNWSGLVGPGDTHRVNICRRISAVATQVASNAFFLNYPCSADGIPPSEPNATNSTYRVIDNDLIPDERACLQGFNNGTTFARGFTASGAPINESPLSATDNYAVGPLFVDNNPSSEAFTWDFLKIDGIDPTVANSVSGAFRYQNTAVINLHVNSQAADPGTLKGQLTDMLIQKFQVPNLLAIQNGFMAIPESGYVPGLDGNNVLAGSSSAKTCKVPIILQ